MSKLTIISDKEMISLLILLGFKKERQKGSHIIFTHPDGRKTVVPYYNEDLGRGLIRKILKDIEIPIPEYERLRKQL
ncbi:MAG: type II toxin-antitoxin system HicA family toxin [Syntrophomonadaceae bacterium]|nr:type II toxin-antitoxin system HicA family toxin [Syntrophomonadaceae bacterium]